MSAPGPPPPGEGTDPGPLQRPGDRSARRRQREGLARLAFAVAVIVTIAVVLHGLAELIVVVALIVMVMIHELGHFATAKWSKMKVTEYFLGFGPRLWSIRRGETEYGIKALPAGGYVRIIGMTMLEEVDPADEARSYRQASFPRRLLVAVAGSATHFIVAFVLLWAMACVSGLPVKVPTGEIEAFTSFAHVKSPAVAAGLRTGDILYAVDGHRYAGADGFVDAIEHSAGTPLRLTVRRDGHLVTRTLTPLDGRHLRLKNPENGSSVVKPPGPSPVGVVGVELSQTGYVTENPLSGLGHAGTMLATVTAGTATGIGEVFSLHGLDTFAHQVANAANQHNSTRATNGSGSHGQTQLLSLPGAVELGAQALQQHVTELLYILVAINIFVGMVNMFPMLPLDGGHVAIACYERVRSRAGRVYHADVAKLMPVAYLFLAFMVIVGLGALYANIVNPVSLNGG